MNTLILLSVVVTFCASFQLRTADINYLTNALHHPRSSFTGNGYGSSVRSSRDNGLYCYLVPTGYTGGDIGNKRETTKLTDIVQKSNFDQFPYIPSNTKLICIPGSVQPDQKHYHTLRKREANPQNPFDGYEGGILTGLNTGLDSEYFLPTSVVPWASLVQPWTHPIPDATRSG